MFAILVCIKKFNSQVNEVRVVFAMLLEFDRTDSM